MRHIGEKIIFVFCIVVFGIVAMNLVEIGKEYYDGQKEYEELKEYTEEKVNGQQDDPTESEAEEKTIDFAELRKINEDIVAWIQIPGIDEMFIGLNDLSLGYGKNFMFELLLDGTVEELCLKFRKGGIPYGFGGIASLGKGMLPSEYVIKEHYRLGSTCAILSRSFCRTDQVTDLKEIQKIFETELPKIRELEEECRVYSEYFWKNRQQVETKIRQICECEDAK